MLKFASLALATLCSVAPPPTAFAAEGDWRGDAPGVRHHIDAADLPAPFTTKSAFNQPRIVARPENAAPRAPAGLSVALFATGLKGPRLIRVAPNGDIFVAESRAGRVRVFRPSEDGAKPDRDSLFIDGLSQPFGLAFYPPGPDPQFLYVGDTDGVVRIPYRNGDLKARGVPETLFSDLWSSGGHWTRDVVFSRDGKRMFVEANHGLGAAWDREENRADVLAFDPDGRNLQTVATGIRNCVTLGVKPADGSLWCATNERDGLGDNLPPDYVAEVRQGAFYGWPWYYIGRHEDPRHAGERPDLAANVTVQDFLIQPHSAPLQVSFYDGAMFPEFRGSAFVALHGSWNRAMRTGSKIVRLIFEDGKPTGEYEDFVTGFIVADTEVWGRPVGVAADKQGALLISEDGNNTIWRVTRH